MPIFRVKSVKIYTGQKNLHGYIRGIRDKLEVCFFSSLILQFFYIFNIRAARGWGFGRALSAVCNYWGSLHGLVHPRVLCQVWYLILDNLIFNIWDCIIWYLIYCIYCILSGSSPAQARWGERVFQVIQWRTCFRLTL